MCFTCPICIYSSSLSFYCSCSTDSILVLCNSSTNLSNDSNDFILKSLLCPELFLFLPVSSFCISPESGQSDSGTTFHFCPKPLESRKPGRLHKLREGQRGHLEGGTSWPHLEQRQHSKHKQRHHSINFELKKTIRASLAVVKSKSMSVRVSFHCRTRAYSDYSWNGRIRTSPV